MTSTAIVTALLMWAGAQHPPAVTAAPGVFCSPEPEIEFSAARTRRIVRSAEVVVRAVMVGSATGKTLKPWDSDTLAFEVREVLKGENIPATLTIPGVMVDWDDLQMGAMPLLSHRTRYSEGACITSFYRTGAEYLLLLRHRPDDPSPAGLTPYWMLLAPTNEQITGPHDPWADWVRNELRRAPPRHRER